MNQGLTAGTFIEVGHWCVSKNGQGAAGDTFLSRKQEKDGRLVSVLSDGLGSGIKAGVLSTLTATMALKFRITSYNVCYTKLLRVGSR